MFTKFFAPFCPLVFLFWVFDKKIQPEMFNFNFGDFKETELSIALIVLNVFAVVVAILEYTYSKKIKDNPIPTTMIYIFGSINIINFSYLTYFSGELYWPSVGLFLMGLLLGFLVYLIAGFLKDIRLYSRTKHNSKITQLPRVPRPLKYTVYMLIIIILMVLFLVKIIFTLYDLPVSIFLLGFFGPTPVSVVHLFTKDRLERIKEMQSLFDTYDAQINLLEGESPLSFEEMEKMKKSGVNAALVLNSSIASKVVMLADIDGETKLLNLNQAFDTQGRPKHQDMMIQIPKGITLNLMEMVELSLLPSSEKIVHNMVEIVLKDGSSPDEVYAEGWTPFLFAAANCNIPITNLMIQYGADVNQSTYTGRRAINYVVSHGSLEMLKLLITNGAEIEFEAEGNKIVSSPLQIAAENGREEMVDFLLEKGANFTIKNKLGYDAMHYAKVGKHNKIIRKFRLESNKSKK